MVLFLMLQIPALTAPESWLCLLPQLFHTSNCSTEIPASLYF